MFQPMWPVCQFMATIIMERIINVADSLHALQVGDSIISRLLPPGRHVADQEGFHNQRLPDAALHRPQLATPCRAQLALSFIVH